MRSWGDLFRLNRFHSFPRVKRKTADTQGIEIAFSGETLGISDQLIRFYVNRIHMKWRERTRSLSQMFTPVFLSVSLSLSLRTNSQSFDRISSFHSLDFQSKEHCHRLRVKEFSGNGVDLEAELDRLE